MLLLLLCCKHAGQQLRCVRPIWAALRQQEVGLDAAQGY
jgi:hypothetical protein